MIRVVVVCDLCRREAELPAGRTAEDLSEYAGWRVVREEAICPACLAVPATPCPAIHLSPPWTDAQRERVRRAHERRMSAAAAVAVEFSGAVIAAE